MKILMIRLPATIAYIYWIMEFLSWIPHNTPGWIIPTTVILSFIGLTRILDFLAPKDQCQL